MGRLAYMLLTLLTFIVLSLYVAHIIDFYCLTNFTKKTKQNKTKQKTKINSS